jgi:hypothetical protein
MNLQSSGDNKSKSSAAFLQRIELLQQQTFVSTIFGILDNLSASSSSNLSTESNSARTAFPPLAAAHLFPVELVRPITKNQAKMASMKLSRARPLVAP